jgi:hypothetical protein
MIVLRTWYSGYSLIHIYHIIPALLESCLFFERSLLDINAFCTLPVSFLFLAHNTMSTNNLSATPSLTPRFLEIYLVVTAIIVKLNCSSMD